MKLYIALGMLVLILLTACGPKKITLPADEPYHPELEHICCKECKDAFDQSPVATSEAGARCGDFTTGRPLSKQCQDYFEVNYMSVSACKN